ncbi:hypothetical protein [Shewanella aestuarii]|uniref:Uncharacterized protein n=1 Tax=Shewanella aestuarii TaxID=1028752 RepID=A0A6G9QRD9_9GAMM|nr:hypothetical protein [Shewanella aestuarii]QIR16615.1 hypothetical protein HBH39_19255 [Shewanella aestuarii]
MQDPEIDFLLKEKKLTLSFDECIYFAQKSLDFDQFTQRYPFHYNRAFENDWLELCSLQFSLSNVTKITEIECLNAAARSGHMFIFREFFPHHYTYALNEGLLKSCKQEIDFTSLLNKKDLKRHFALVKSKEKAKADKLTWIMESSLAQKGKQKDLGYKPRASFHKFLEDHDYELTMPLSEDVTLALEECRDLDELRLKYPKEYNKAVRQSWISRCKVILNKKKPKDESVQILPISFIKHSITREDCIADARKYETRTDWQNNSFQIHNRARKMNWLSDCCRHMKQK